MKRDQINLIKARLAKKYYKNRCFVCHCKKSKSGMTFHHLWYVAGEMTSADFKDKLEYYTQLENWIRQNPRRFLYVCSDHHQAIERNSRWGEQNFRRLLRAIRMTRKSRTSKIAMVQNL